MIASGTSIRDIIEKHKSLLAADLMGTPEVSGLCAFLGAAVSNQDPADVAIAIALIFGSLCFDAEMQAALQIAGRSQLPATFEERLELFGVHARAGYEGVKAYAQAEQPYNDGKKAM